MGKKLVIISAILAAIAWPIGIFLHDELHSPFADFTAFILFPFFLLVFLLSFFVVPLRGKIVFIGRIVVLTAIAVLLIIILWPRSYGTLPQQKRGGIQYWDLPTGSRIAYTLLPAKGEKKPYPIIYLEGGPGGAVGE